MYIYIKLHHTNNDVFLKWIMTSSKIFHFILILITKFCFKNVKHNNKGYQTVSVIYTHIKINEYFLKKLSFEMKMPDPLSKYFSSSWVLKTLSLIGRVMYQQHSWVLSITNLLHRELDYLSISQSWVLKVFKTYAGPEEKAFQVSC